MNRVQLVLTLQILVLDHFFSFEWLENLLDLASTVPVVAAWVAWESCRESCRVRYWACCFCIILFNLEVLKKLHYFYFFTYLPPSLESCLNLEDRSVLPLLYSSYWLVFKSANESWIRDKNRLPVNPLSRVSAVRSINTQMTILLMEI